MKDYEYALNLFVPFFAGILSTMGIFQDRYEILILGVLMWLIAALMLLFENLGD